MYIYICICPLKQKIELSNKYDHGLFSFLLCFFFVIVVDVRRITVLDMSTANKTIVPDVEVSVIYLYLIFSI